MSHIGSFLWALATLSVGGKVVARSTDGHELLPLLREQQPTILRDGPGGAVGPRSRPRSAARRLLLAAAVPGRRRQGLDRAADRVRRNGGLPDRRGYGMTEVGLATMNPPSGEIRQGSIRRPIHGFRSRCEMSRAHRSGRTWARSGSAAAPACSATGRRSARPRRLHGGWLDSGDLARQMRTSYLWFFGRKQVIVHDGSNISPYEVEGASSSTCGLAGRCRRRPRRGPRRERARLRDAADGVEPPSRADLIVFPRAHRLQGTGRDCLPRRDAPQSDRQDRSGRPQANGGGPPSPPRSELIAWPAPARRANATSSAVESLVSSP